MDLVKILNAKRLVQAESAKSRQRIAYDLAIAEVVLTWRRSLFALEV